MNENNNYNNNFLAINPFKFSNHITKILIFSLFALFFLLKTATLT